LIVKFKYRDIPRAVAFGAVLLGTLFVATVAVAEAPQERPIPIRAVSPEGAVLYQGSGLIRGANLWVPLEAIRAGGLSVAVDSAEARVILAFPSPSWKLATRSLSGLLAGGVRLDLRGRRDEKGAYFLNVRGLDRILDLAILPEADGGVRLVSRSAGPVSAGEGPLGENRPPSGPLLSGASSPIILAAPEPGASAPEEALAPVRRKIPLSGPILLAWDHILRVNPDLDASPPPAGLDVLSPTWFVLADAAGTIRSDADPAYAEAAARRGVRVWALWSNGFDADRTSAFLADPGAQDRAVAGVLSLAAVLGLDGINLDFEKIRDGDRGRYTAFVARLANACREAGLFLSVDVTVVSDKPLWSNCYDRAALGRLVDYVALMTYDEHWRSSPVAGSVASLPWVEKKLRQLSGVVPREKLLLGVPFYTREWTEIREGRKVKVSSRALSMTSADRRVREAGVQPRWLPDKGQHYVEFREGGTTRKIWMEDVRSMERRAALVRRYGVAGVAAWRRGFEAPEIWGVLLRVLKGGAAANPSDVPGTSLPTAP
jgi:spore germination protein YaaH